MIESKEMLVERFLRLSARFQESPDPVTGIDFDDAVVTLKRYVISHMKNEQTGMMLGRFQKLIRAGDRTSVSELTREVEKRLLQSS